MNVRLTKAATADIEKAATWSEAQAEGLGTKFLDRVLETIDKIVENPKAYAAVIQDVRLATVRKFPYGLWFRVAGDVIVIACLHGSRDRRLAQERALGIIQMPDPS